MYQNVTLSHQRYRHRSRNSVHVTRCYKILKLNSKRFHVLEISIDTYWHSVRVTLSNPKPLQNNASYYSKIGRILVAAGVVDLTQTTIYQYFLFLNPNLLPRADDLKFTNHQ